MSYLNIALDKVRAIFGEDALEPSIAASIFGYVDEHRNVRHINLGFVKQLCKLPHNEKSDVAILKTLQALSGDAIGYLSVGFEYVDENEEIHNISRTAFVDAIQNSIDPFSGEPAQDLAGRVLIFYYPDESFPKRLIHE
jgi:hypothetical protein